VLAADEQRLEFLAVALLGPAVPRRAKLFHVLVRWRGPLRRSRRRGAHPPYPAIPRVSCPAGFIFTSTA